MNKIVSIFTATLLAAMACSAVHADTPLLTTTFEADTGGWTSLNAAKNEVSTEAVVKVVHDAESLKEGKGSLKFDYTIKKGNADLLVLQAGPGTISKANSIHFWIKPDHSTSFLLILSEKDGGRYQSTFTAPGKSWQEVSISLKDMLLNDDEGSPKDPDGKLDADQIEYIGLIDADSYLAQVFGDAPPFVNFTTGNHSLLLSPFSVNAMELTPAPAAAEGDKLLATFLRPQLDWVVIGGATVQKVADKPLSGPALKATCVRAKGKLFGLLHQLKPGLLTGASQVLFSAASEAPATLMVQFEESDGGKYQTTVQIPGGKEVKEVALKLADFTPADDSKDTNTTLDYPLITKIMIVDVSGLGEVEEKSNSLWINNLRVHAASK